jgi:hypothetical protein
MIDNAVIQADIVAALKANSTVTSALVRQDGEGGAENVKESQWAGTDFTFPAIRVRVNRQIPITDRQNCDHARLSFSIRCLTEGGSSKPADELAGLVNSQFHGNAGGGKFFRGTGWSTYLRGSGLVSALRTGEKLWMAEAQFEGVVYPI